MEFQSTKGTVEASLPVPQHNTNHSPAFQSCQVLLLGDLWVRREKPEEACGHCTKKPKTRLE